MTDACQTSGAVTIGMVSEEGGGEAARDLKRKALHGGAFASTTWETLGIGCGTLTCLEGPSSGLAVVLVAIAPYLARIALKNKRNSTLSHTGLLCCAVPLQFSPFTDPYVQKPSTFFHLLFHPTNRIKGWSGLDFKA